METRIDQRRLESLNPEPRNPELYILHPQRPEAGAESGISTKNLRVYGLGFWVLGFVLRA